MYCASSRCVDVCRREDGRGWMGGWMGGYIDGKPWLLGSKGYSVGSRMMLWNRHRDICLKKKKKSNCSNLFIQYRTGVPFKCCFDLQYSPNQVCLGPLNLKNPSHQMTTLPLCGPRGITTYLP